MIARSDLGRWAARFRTAKAECFSLPTRSRAATAECFARSVGFRAATAEGFALSARRIAAAATMLFVLANVAHALEVEVGIAPEYRQWAYEQSGDAHRVSQSYLPIDARIRIDDATQVRAGADFVTSVHHGAGRTGNLDGPGDARILVERKLAADRVLLRAGGRFALFEDAFTPREIRVAEVLELPGLSFPLAQPGAGNRYAIDAAAQVLQRRTLSASLAAGIEMRTEFTLREDGLVLDPGSLARVGAVVEQTAFRAIFRHQLVAEFPSGVNLDGRAAFQPGNRLRISERWSRAVGTHELDVHAGLLLVAGGTVSNTLAIDAATLRGGNRLAWGAALTLGPSRRYELGLDATHHRGFSGPLGHSDWVTPSFGVAFPFARGVASLRVDGSLGKAREGGRLDGVGVRLSVRQGTE